MSKITIKNKINFIFIHVALMLLVFMTLLPLGWILSTSLKPNSEIFANPPYWIPKNPTSTNYVEVLTTSSIPTAFLNSFIIALGCSIMALILGCLAGYAFARFKFRGKSFLSLFMLISQMLPLTVLMIPLFYMGNASGLVDTKFGLALAHLVIALPLATWMSKGYFLGIPREIEEAAMVDGCSTIQNLTQIVLPLLRPALAATGIYAFISSWNEYALANVLTRTDASRTVPLALNDFSTFFKVNWGSTMAAAAVITIPIITVFLSVQKQFVEGLASGAVKG